MPPTETSHSTIATGLNRERPGDSTRLTTISAASAPSQPRPLANAAAITAA